MEVLNNVNNLTTGSSDDDLKRFATQLEQLQSRDKQFTIQIRSPDGNERQFMVSSGLISNWDERDDGELFENTTQRLRGEVYSLNSVAAVLRPLDDKTKAVISVPVGEFRIDYLDDATNLYTHFVLVRLLCKGCLGLMFDYTRENATERKAKFPGVDGELSLGILTGEFKISEGAVQSCSNPLELEVISNSGFTVEDADRSDGIIHPVKT